MALALTNPLALMNPNDRRRINKITRIVMKHHGGNLSAVKPLVAKWEKEKGLPATKRSKIFQNTPKGQGKTLVKKLVSGGAKKQSEARRKQYSKVRYAVAKAFGQMKGYKASKRLGSYAHRAVGSKARRYYTKAYKVPARSKKGKLMKIFGRSYMGTSAKAIRAHNQKTMGRPAGTRNFKRPPFLTRGRKAGVAKPARRAAAGSASRQARLMARAQQLRAQGMGMGPALRQANREYGLGLGKSGRGKAYAGKSGHPRSAAAWANPLALQNCDYGALALTNGRRRRRGRKNPLALSNYGALALSNPIAQAAMDFGKNAGAVILVGAGVGALHYFVVPKVLPYLDKVTSKIPMVGQYVAMVPYTTVGLGAAAVLTAAAFYARRSDYSKVATYLAAAGAGAMILGAGVDTMNILSDRESGTLTAGLPADVAAAVAGGDVGALAYENFGDGGAFENVPFGSGPDLYGQASLADAYYSGADFDVLEGQCCLNGPAVFTGKFGRPVVRQGTQARGASQYAGQRGHRWGWLVKMIGWPRVQKLAAMAPKQRVDMIQKLRAAAIQAYNEQTVAQAAADSNAMPSTGLPAAGTVAGAPTGPQGPMSANMGSPALFMGD